MAKVDAHPSLDDQLKMFEDMLRNRRFEERVTKLFQSGAIPGFVHVDSGQEAVAIGVCDHLGPADAIFSTHRGHGHALAKGISPDELMAELFGRATGCCKGKGGSMHVARTDIGMLGANGIVGAGGPLASGAALSFKTLGTDNVSVAFFGDAAMMQGGLHESLNLAQVLDLPMIFVCENNGLAQATPIEYYTANPRLAAQPEALGMRVLEVDGMDVLAVHAAAGDAVSWARAGNGPTFIEASTHRFSGHFLGDPDNYKGANWKKRYADRDPISRLRDQLQQQGALTEEAYQKIDERVRATIDAAVDAAKEAPWPDTSELLTDVYADYPVEMLSSTY